MEEQKEDKQVNTAIDSETPVKTEAETITENSSRTIDTTDKSNDTITNRLKENTQIDISQIDTSDFPNVRIYFSIKDSQGNIIDNIASNSLMISERTDNTWKKIASISDYKRVDSLNLKTVAMVIDTSGSMEQSLGQVQDAAQTLLDSMREEGNYQVSLTSFNSKQNMLQDFTNDITSISDDIYSLYADGETAFYDTLENTLYKCNSQMGQKYILALTDGVDNVSSVSKDEVIKLAKIFKIPIYIISTMEEAETKDLFEIAESSGGELYHINHIGALKDIYIDIYQLQKNQMYVSYQTSNKGQWCDIQLQLESDIYEGEVETSYLADRISTTEMIDNKIIQSVLTSSELAAQTDSKGSYNYRGENALDGNYNTAWVEGVEGNGEGEWLHLDFDKSHTINGIEMSNGYKKRRDLYLKNNRLKEIRVWFSDNTYEDFLISDDFTGIERLDFSKACITKSIRIEILSVYKGSKYQDTCITDVCVY